MHDDDDNILRRLERLERMLMGRTGDPGPRHDDHHHHHHRGPDEHRRDEHDEKRIIDTIVRLVSERVEEILDRRLGKRPPDER